MQNNIKNQSIFYYPELRANLELEGQIAFQIAKILRHKKGDKIMLTDGRGNRGVYEITDMSKEFIAVDQLESIQSSQLPPLVLVFALLKSDKNEIVLQKALELGATRILIFESEHSVSKLKDIQKKTERWKRILIETMEQCLGSYLPEIELYRNLEEVFQSLPEESEIFTLSFDAEKSLKEYDISLPVLIIGPEGDFSQKEFQLMKEKGANTVYLCPHLLKAETASIAAMAQIQLLRS